MEELKYKKQYGQNFIYDGNLLKAIVNDAKIDNNDEVLEIGVGVGSLTKNIATVAKKLICYEIDDTLKPRIDENIKEFNNVFVNYKDIMRAEKDEILSQFNGQFKIVANLPYYITTPIIFKFLEGNYPLLSMTIMVQKEVGERICAKEGNKDYGILSVMLQTFSDCNIVRQINRKMFTPVPNVDSCLVKIDIDKNKFNITNYDEYRKFINTCFSMRRKTLSNNLKEYVGKEKLLTTLNQLGLKENVRSEELSIKNFVELFNLLKAN